MTDDERQVHVVRQRLLEASYANDLSALQALTGIGRGTLLHALLAVGSEQPAARVLTLWHDWTEGLTNGREYENFAVYVRNRSLGR